MIVLLALHDFKSSTTTYKENQIHLTRLYLIAAVYTVLCEAWGVVGYKDSNILSVLTSAEEDKIREPRYKFDCVLKMKNTMQRRTKGTVITEKKCSVELKNHSIFSMLKW